MKILVLNSIHRLHLFTYSPFFPFLLAFCLYIFYLKIGVSFVFCDEVDKDLHDFKVNLIQAIHKYRVAVANEQAYTDLSNLVNKLPRLDKDMVDAQKDYSIIISEAKVKIKEQLITINSIEDSIGEIDPTFKRINYLKSSVYTYVSQR